MISRANVPLVLSIWLIVSAILGHAQAERWSRQVSNSEWIPLANPRNQAGHNQNHVPPPLPQIHQPLIPGSLPPELRQEYQQQLLQLQKTQESIQRLLLLQQQLKAQQNLLQGQAFGPNGISETQENKQALHQGAIANSQTLPELAPEVLVVQPQPSTDARPPIYMSQNFREPQGEAIGQEQYEDYSDRQPEDYRNSERTREKEKYMPEVPSGSANDGESGDDGEEEIQVVYVPAETLAQRGQSKNHQRGRDRKQFGNQNVRHHQQLPEANQHQSFSETSARERENVPTTVSPEQEAYAREFLQQLQREHEGTDRLLKEAREKELERLRDERKEIQRRAKLQQAALEREQEIQRQREAEKQRKELAKLEEDAKQRELERIRESRERHRLEEIERTKKAQARVNAEKRKQEEARQEEIERLAALERQKKAEIERTIAAQKELERIQKEDEERAREAERSHLSRQKETSRDRYDEAKVSPQAQPLVRSQQNHQQQLSQTGKYNRHGRIRNKPRQRQNIEHSERTNQEITTVAPPSPNQPPLAVYMSNLDGNTRVLRIADVLKTLKDAKTIDVLDNVGQDAPQVFVGPSNLEVPAVYTKFDLPYLSSIDNNRVERRVDKLPFFVAPLSFNPPPGYSKIPFPAPHIGSVVINTLDSNIAITQQDESLDDARKLNLNPLIEPNSFSDNSNQGISYSPNYDASTTPIYANYRQEEPSSTPQYQSSPSYSSVAATGPGQTNRFRQPFGSERPSGSEAQEQSKLTYHENSQSRPTYQEEPSLPLGHNHADQYNDDSTGSTTPAYRRPNVVTSFAYQESPQPVSSSTPTYQESYSNIRDDSSNRPLNSQLVSANRYQLPDQRENERGQEYSNSQVDSGGISGYEDVPRGPTQYNLPAELPPIHPQLPGLVNSLLEENEGGTFFNGQSTVPATTSTTTTTTTTTTEVPTTTQRSRGRHRGRLVATRPSTTTTTTLSPPSKSRDTERTRRPFGRTRTRFTTTTEEYRETYEPTKSKVTATTPRYNVQDNYRRPASTKTQRYKNRENERVLHTSRNQVHNVQAHEAVNDRNPTLDSNSRFPETTGVGSNEPLYTQFNFASPTTSLENYPVLNSDDSRVENMPSNVENSKKLNYHQARPLALGNPQSQGEPISQQYQERYPTSDFSQTGLEEAPVNGFNYQIRDEQTKSTPTIPPRQRDFSYYQNKQEDFDSSQIPVITTESPIDSRGNDYQRSTLYDNSEGNTSGSRPNGGTLYDPYSPDNQDGLRTTELLPEQAPLELTTEVPTTTTTTEATPVIIRQRVRARLGGRGRPDSLVQTRPRGSQDEYVRFSAVNNQNVPTTSRPASRSRENHRTRPKTRQQNHGVQVQTEGNDYVRIQSPVRSYQKTIVTPPSTTQRTTTTPAPTTTTAEYETSNDELEYGFIRPPNFSPIHPPENRYQNSFRPIDNQAHLQSIVPTDETAADSIPSRAQVSSNRPRYQSLDQRQTGKAITSTTVAHDILSYTERPGHRVEEPKNNRIRVRGRKPGRRRTTTTTTTTTEYVLDENNDLPLDENYPRPVQTLEDLNSDRQAFYEEKFEALPLGSGVTSNPVQHQDRENSFSNQDFVLNFGSETDQIPDSESDQTQSASEPSRKYGHSGGTRSRTHSTSRGSNDRDIYGSESQWSTKLTSASFQPSPNVNRLPQDYQKSLSFSENEKNKYSNDEASADEPEIITAPPEETYVTVLVTSDDKMKKSAIPSADTSLEASSMEGSNYGMKTSVQTRNNFFESTTSASSNQDTFVPNSSILMTSTTDATNESGNYGETVRENPPMRKGGGRRRRVRVRVRPAITDDFVTAESQHFNSAVNNLLQDRLKYHHRQESPRERTFMMATSPSSISDESVTTESLGRNILEDLLKEVFKNDNKTSGDSEITTSDESKNGTVTSDMSENGSVIADESKNGTVTSDESKDDLVTSNESKVVSIASFPDPEPQNPIKMISVDSDESEVTSNQSGLISTTPNQLEVDSTSEISINQETTINDSSNTETTVFFTEENPKIITDSSVNEFSTNRPLMTTMTIPRKSWDSTKRYIDSIAMQSSELSSNLEDNRGNDDFNDNTTGQENEVFENDYREEAIRNEDNTLKTTNEEENYPKNHRSQWSEVRYPTNRELYNYNRKINLTTTQLPGIVTKSDGDTSVKTLSDYVKAIFDTMKNADEEKNDQESFTTAESISDDRQTVSTSINDSSETNENLDSIVTTISSIQNLSTANSEKFEYSSEETVSNFKETEEKHENFEESTISVNTENSSRIIDNEGFTEQPESTETTIYAEETTEIPTETSPVDSLSFSIASESSVPSSTVNSIESKNVEVTFSTNENSLQTNKNSTETKLGAILRTSTTTKVSHMTEICYRGRCVMTKPKKEIRAR